MRIRGKLALSIFGAIGATIYRTWIGSIRSTDVWEDPTIDPLVRTKPGGCIFCLWHDVLLLPTYRYRKGGQYTLISQSDDGNIIDSMVTRLGWKTVRGSSTRGGVGALRELLEIRKQSQRMDICVTADGPRGPRHVVKEGVIYLASKTGLSIACVGVAHHRPWRAKSWDRFTLPKPFSRASLIVGTPIDVPPNLSREDMEQARLNIQSEMDRLELKSEYILAGKPTASLTPNHSFIPKTRAA